MRARQTLPLLWLLSDARNDARLDRAIGELPPRSGIVYRHYHLDMERRRARFEELTIAAERTGRGHVLVLADDARTAREWGARGVYGDTLRCQPADGLLKLVTAHDGDELAAAERAGADGVFLSPVYPTRSHPEARPLGIHGFHVLAQRASVPVIALGGMTAARAQELAWPRWGAIDGLVSTHAA